MFFLLLFFFTLFYQGDSLALARIPQPTIFLTVGARSLLDFVGNLIFPLPGKTVTHTDCGPPRLIQVSIFLQEPFPLHFNVSRMGQASLVTGSFWEGVGVQLRLCPMYDWLNNATTFPLFFPFPSNTQCIKHVCRTPSPRPPSRVDLSENARPASLWVVFLWNCPLWDPRYSLLVPSLLLWFILNLLLPLINKIEIFKG